MTNKPSGSVRPAPWRVQFFQRHSTDDPLCTVPALAFLRSCPAKVEAMSVAVVKAVAAAPPPAFSGGGKWEAMHGDMSGFYEVRVDGPKRRHYRRFCILEVAAGPSGLAAPASCCWRARKSPSRRFCRRRTTPT